MHLLLRFFFLIPALAPPLLLHAAPEADAKGKPNVLFIVCDDLNDYIETLGGHPQARTPNIRRLIESGVSFTQAHCNIPICNPSRASFLTGLYLHTSGCYGFDHWDGYEVLKNSRTLMAHFRHHGYHTLGTGKVMHNRGRDQWSEFGYLSDYGPFANDGQKKDVAHPDIPSPFRDDFGAVDGSFGPLQNLEGTPFTWRTGNWAGKRELKYQSETDRDPTGDELNAAWAVKKLGELSVSGKPFLMGLGFIRPHTPLIVPRKYFDLFPLESIKLPEIRLGDIEDTFKHTLAPGSDDRSDDRGHKMYSSLIKSFKGDRELALRKFIQAYLASVASVDDLVGEVLKVIESSSLKDNTIIVFTSDHGWGMGEKDYLYKNSLWQESTRVPLVIRAPGVSKAGEACPLPVSLVDLFPTLLDLCGLSADTRLNPKGRPLDGYSLKPLLMDPQEGAWDGPESALTALYKWADYYDPAGQSYSQRYRDWRYVRYANGKEELYHTAEDPHEWHNLAGKPEQAGRLQRYRKDLLGIIPSRPLSEEQKATRWKIQYFKKNPSADTNKDGKLSWPELNAHRGKKNPAGGQKKAK
ncbi:MAG TPA: hypothetical protein DCQ96_11925 [Verrucomicrobiales bacterium]|nr:hypothetical protein [Verrucomicrobiales bacterium]